MNEAIFVALLLLVFLVILHCPCGKRRTNRKFKKKNARTTCRNRKQNDHEAKPKPIPFTASMLADIAGFLDRSFNANGLVGMCQAAFDFDIEIRELIAKGPDSNDAKLQQFIAEQTAIVITLGVAFAEATAAAAQSAPEIKFAAIDVVYPATTPNLQGIVFASQEGAFLAGYLAAGMSTTGKVGTYGGEQIPPVVAFMTGYAGGVTYYNQQHGTNVQTLGLDLFVGDFVSLPIGRQFTLDLIAQGADIIFPVAGPIGLATAQVCFETGQALFIGVDSDWFETALDFHSIVLSSVLKRINVAAYNAIAAVRANQFQGGEVLYNLANNGVDLAPYHDFEPVVPPALKAEIVVVKQGIINGTIIVPG